MRSAVRRCRAMSPTSTGCAAKDYAALVPRLRAVSTAADLELVLNWERARILDGGGFVIVYAYMSDLWRFGAALLPAPGDGLKQTAGAMFAYAVTLVALDGMKCEDASAPGHRRDQLLSQNPDLLRYVAAQPRAARMTMGTVALAFDAATRTLRRNDDVLCRGGMSEMTAGLKAQGDKPMEQAPSTPGMVGKTLPVAGSRLRPRVRRRAGVAAQAGCAAPEDGGSADQAADRARRWRAGRTPTETVTPGGR